MGGSAEGSTKRTSDSILTAHQFQIGSTSKEQRSAS
jgi:hypothetical protein